MKMNIKLSSAFSNRLGIGCLPRSLVSASRQRRGGSSWGRGRAGPAAAGALGGVWQGSAVRAPPAAGRSPALRGHCGLAGAVVALGRLGREPGTVGCNLRPGTAPSGLSHRCQSLAIAS